MVKRAAVECAWHLWISRPALAMIASNLAVKSLNSRPKWFLHSHSIAIRSSDLWGNLPYTACFSMPIHQANEQSISAMVHCHFNESLKDIYHYQFEYQQTKPQIGPVCQLCRGYSSPMYLFSWLWRKNFILKELYNK